MPPTNIASQAAAHPFEDRLSYAGWRVAAVCHLGVLTGFATVFIYSFSFMMKPLQHDFGWNREQISLAFSLAAVSVAICSPFMGKLFDRFEPRKLIAGFTAAFGLGMMSLAYLTPNLSQFYGCCVFIGVAGTGTYQLGYARIVSLWFERRLGAALAIVVAGSGIGSFVVPPLVEYLIGAYGWRHTYLILALLPLLLGAPSTLFFARSPHARSASARRNRRDVEPSIPSIGSTWREALRTRGFWLLALGVCCVSLSENGALAHLAPLLSGHGLSLRDVALVASVLGGSSLAGRFLLGSLLDYIEGSYIAAVSLLASGAGIFLLARAHSFQGAAPAALITGLGAGCELDLIPYVLRRYFGLRAFSTLYGLVYSIFAFAGALSPLMLGHIYDVTGSYTGILSLFSGVTVAAAFAMLALPSYRGASNALPQTAAFNPLTNTEKGAVFENH